MRAMILSEPEFCAVGPELFKAVRRGRFPEVFALLYDDAGLNADEYAAIGAALDSTLRMPDSQRKRDELGRLGFQVSGWLGLNGRKSDDPKRQALVNSFSELARRHDGSRSWEPKPETLIGFVVGAATASLAAGVRAEDLDRDPEGLAEAASAAVRGTGLSFSITDVKDTLEAMMLTHSIADWVCDEDVAAERSRLAKFGRNDFSQKRR